MTTKVSSLRLLLWVHRTSRLSTGIQFRNKLVKAIDPRCLVMPNAQVKILKKISVTHSAKVTKMALPALKTIMCLSNTKVFPVQSNLTKINKDFMQTAQETIQHPTQIQTRAVKWAILTKPHLQRSTRLTKARLTIGLLFWNQHLSIKTVRLITQVILEAGKMKILFKGDQHNHKLTNKWMLTSLMTIDELVQLEQLTWIWMKKLNLREKQLHLNQLMFKSNLDKQ